MVWNKLSEKEADFFFERIKLQPLEPYISNGSPRKCKCLVCGSIVYPRLGDVKKAKSCVKCQGKNTGKSIRLSEAEVVSTAKKMNVKLLEAYENSRTPIKAKCLKCKNIIYPTIGRLRDGVGCMHCGRIKSASARAIPKDIALEAFRIAKLEVLSEYKRATEPVKVLCLICKKHSTKSLKDLKTGRRCYTCGRAQASLNRRLNQDYMADVALLQRLKPIGQIKPVRENSKFECLKCQRQIQMTFSSIQRGAYCRFCSRTEIDPKEAYDYMVKNHLVPQEPFKKSATKWKCRCAKCGNTVFPTFNNVSTSGGGCKYCRSAGYNPSFSGHLYLMYNAEFDSYKIGISNLKSRIRRHELRDWSIVRIWEFENGLVPPELEEKVLTHIRENWKLAWSVEAKDMPQGGHTETFSAIDLPESRIIRLVASKIKNFKQ
jgi:hypothetical protein